MTERRRNPGNAATTVVDAGMGVLPGLGGTEADFYSREVPLRGLVISVLALAGAGFVSLAWPDALDEYSGFVWVLALVPLVLLSYYKGWRGAALASVATMIVFTGAQLVVVYGLGEGPDWSYYGFVTIILMAVSFGAGWVTEKLHRDRIEALRMAYEDPLTRLASRRILDSVLEDRMAEARRGRALSIVLFDLDGFKEFNDRHGHTVGDELLRRVGRVFRANTRETNLTGRFGGEEFLTVLPGESGEGARVFAERICEEVRNIELRGEGGCTISAGVAEFESHVSDGTQLLERADRALYAAKREGGDAAVAFTEDVAEMSRRPSAGETAGGIKP